MKIRGLIQLVLTLVIASVLPANAQAGQCALTYVDGLTNSTTSGSIKFTNYGRLINNTDTVLATSKVFNNGFATTCTSADCSAGGSGTVVPQLTGSFTTHTSSTNLSINGYSTTIANNDYKDVTVKNFGSLTMSSSFTTYTFKKLKVESNSTVNLRPGIYYIDDLEIKGGSVLNVIGTGTAKIYTKSKAKFKESSIINYGSSGDASKLFLYHFATGEDKIKIESGAKVTAIMYSAGKVEMKGVSDVYGAISAESEIHIKNDSWVTFQSSAIANTDFGSACSSGPATVDHYQITHDNSGSTCAAESITIKACLNADCSVLSTDEVSLDFTTDGATKSSPTFTGTTTFDFTHTTVETLTLAVGNPTITPTNVLVCSGGSCDITFTSTGCSSGNTCATTFADAATNSSINGSIKFEDWGRLIDNPDAVLSSNNVIHNNSIFTTCGTGNCTGSGTIVPALTGTFVANTSSSNLTVNGNSTTITTDDYKDVNVKNGGRLYMSSGYSTYRFKKLKVEFLSAVYLTPGDYYIDDLEVKGASSLNVVGSGTVRLFVKSNAKFKELSLINGGLFGDASKLFLYYFASDDEHVHIESAATFAGFIYSKNKVEMKSYGAVYGGVTAEGEIKIKDVSSITYRQSAIADTDFGDACSPSGSVVDHYRFKYDGAGLTCQSQTVTIEACANAACSELYKSPTSLTLKATSATTPPSSVSSNVSFSTGSADVILAESAATTVSLSMNSASPSANLQCYQNGAPDGNCDYSLSDSGFIFWNQSDSSLDFPSQISGKPTDVGYHKKTMVLQAVQTNTTTGACSALFANDSIVAVDLAYQCEDPGSCKVYQCLDPNNCPSNAATVTSLNNTTPTAIKEYGTYSTHNLKFGSDSKATIAITYPDAGKIKLHAKKSIVLAPNETTVMLGNSSSIVFRPFGFDMDMGLNPGATDNSGGIFTRAGEQFDMTLSAVQWQAGQDTDENGEPDTGVDLSNNSVTLNFGHEATIETATISTGLVSPATGNNPTLANNHFTSFLAGRQTKSGDKGLSWGDVGVVSFTAAADGNYLDSGDNISTVIPHVGRFVPSHFRLKSSSLSQACSSFSYMGQNVNLAIDLQAQGVNDIELLNYDGGSGNHGMAIVSIVGENNNQGSDLGSRFSAMPLDWVDGTISTTFTPSFSRLSGTPWLDGPYDNMYVGVRVDDGDAAAVINLVNSIGGATNMNAGDTGSCSDKSNCNALAIHAGEVKYRYGRLSSDATFGPASSKITAPIQTEYWDSKTFALSLLDSCSTLQASNIDMSGVAASPFASRYDVKDLTSDSKNGSTAVDTSSPGTTSTSLSASNGYFYLMLDAPIFNSGSNTGYVPITIDATAYPWLQYDWDTLGQGPVDPMLPTQNVTFGQFRGNDRVIYWREKR